MKSVLTTLCYIERDGKYLMLHRTKKKNDPSHDLWLGLGGHFERGESPEDCVKREVLEESGLTMNDPQLRGIVTFSDENFYEYMFLFSCKDFCGELNSCDEGELCWVEKDRVFNELPIWTGDRVFLKLMDMGEPFFSLKLTYFKKELICTELNGKPADPDEIIRGVL